MAGYAGPFKVILQQGLVFGVGNLVDDDGCSFFRGQAAQVGNAPFGNDNVHIVFGAVDMGAEGNHGADLAALGHAVGKEYRQVAVSGKVTAAADTVHDVGAADVGGVDVAVDIAFNGGVHSNNAQTAQHFRVVGNFLRTQDQVFLIFVKVLVQFFHIRSGRGQGSARSHSQLAGINQVEHPVLDNFRKYGQVLKIGVYQAVDNSIGYRAYAGLQRQQVLGQTAGLDFCLEEVYQVLAHSPGIVVYGRQFAGFIRNVAGNNGRYLVQVAGNVRSTNQIFRLFNGDDFPVRRIQGNVAVMHTFQFHRLGHIDFDDDLLGALHIAAAAAQAGGGDDADFALAQVFDGAGFNNGHIDIPAFRQEAKASQLVEMADVGIHVFNLAIIDGIPAGLVGLVRHTVAYNTGVDHFRIDFRTS